MIIVPAKFLYRSDSLEQACLECGIPEEEVNFRITESRHNGSALAYVADHRIPSTYLLLPMEDGGTAVYLGYLSHESASEEQAVEGLEGELQPGESHYFFDKYPKPAGCA